MTYDPEIEKLLPWYAKGLLERDEKEAVEAYLAAHPDMRLQLDIISDENAAIQSQHDALAGPMPGGLDRLLARIEAEEASKAPIAHTANGLVGGVKRFLSNFSSPAMKFAAAAAAIVIVAQGVVIGGLVGNGSDQARPTTQFTVAAGKEQAQQAVRGALLVAFKKDARMSDVAALLRSISARIVSGPKSGAFFEIDVPTDKFPEGGIEAILESLKARSDVVQFVSINQK